MWESLIVVAVVGILLLTGWAHNYVEWFTLLRTGVWMAMLGTLWSIAAGFVYHTALYRCLQPRGALTPRWWLSPTGLHDVLTAEERRKVMPWFYLGAAGFVIVMAGCAAVLLAVWQMR